MNNPAISKISGMDKIPEQPEYKIELSQWRDGLVIRSPNWLGDAVMTVPAMLQLKKIIPVNCGLFVVCPPFLGDFFKSMPIVDDVLRLHKAHKTWKSHELRRLKKLHAGIGLLFNNSLRDAIHFRLAGVPRLFGAAARGRSILLTRSYKFPKRKNRVMNNLHHAAKYLSMAKALGAPEWNGKLPEFLSPKEHELISPALLEIMEKPDLMALACSAAYGRSKCWPPENFRKVCEYWIEKGGCVFVPGTAGEKDGADEVLRGLPENKAFNLAGKTDIYELIMLLQKSRLTVANDSGIMHLSAILGGKGVAVFGSTDPSSTSPVSANWKILYEKQDCSPCFTRECPESSYRCMHAITPEKVIEAIGEVIRFCVQKDSNTEGKKENF